MLDLLRIRLAQGTPTARFPEAGDLFPDRFRGRPVLSPASCGEDCLRTAGSPIRVDAGGRAMLDLGASVFAPEEGACCPHGAVTFSHDYRLAATDRDGLCGSGDAPLTIQPLDAAMRRLFGRSLRLRSVVAGSCGGCEAELVALGNVVFDLARFGVQFVASPRHADGLVITGIVNTNMRDALLKTWEATPAPRIVIAVGACAVGGGPFADSDECTGIPETIPVDLWVAGCPPHPLTLLDGLLRLLGRLPDDRPGA
ncbi:MAG TPA: hypothetical protein VGA20_05675 [Gemmatimonadales bacterium]